MASLARIIWWTRSPPANPMAAMTAVRMSAGRARGTIAPTATATAKMKIARLAIRRPRNPKATNDLDKSGSCVDAAMNRSTARPASNVTAPSTTRIGTIRARNQCVRDGAIDQASRLVPRSSSRATIDTPRKAAAANEMKMSSPVPRPASPPAAMYQALKAPSQPAVLP